jgi:RNA polymerase-binding transcription factor DksA
MKKTAGKETPSKASAAKETAKEAPREKPKAAAPAAKPAAAAAAASEESAAPKARMTKPELKFFENLLNEKKETLIQELGYLEDNTMRLSSKEGAGDLSSHAYHLADHATETQDREQAFHMASREGKYLFYIEEALDRVRNGTFGVC